MKVVIVATLMLAALITSNSTLFAADFRFSNWGDTKQAVIKAEGRKPAFSKENRMMYEASLFGIKMIAFYQFEGGHLAGGGYTSNEKHINKNDYIDDFEKISLKLTQKYGDKIQDDVIWKNELYQNDPQNMGMAVSVGHLEYNYAWETPNTYINNSLNGDNFEINHYIFYFNKKYMKKRQVEQQNNTDGI